MKKNDDFLEELMRQQKRWQHVIIGLFIMFIIVSAALVWCLLKYYY